jgi:hypothetical protein
MVPITPTCRPAEGGQGVGRSTVDEGRDRSHRTSDVLDHQDRGLVCHEQLRSGRVRQHGHRAGVHRGRAELGPVVSASGQGDVQVAGVDQA